MASGLEAIFLRGAAALDAGDLQGAEELFRSIVEADPRAHPAWNALSVVAVRSGFPDRAMEHARHALEIDRRNPVYLNSLGVACGELGLYADAEKAFRRALKEKPVYPEGLFNLGKVLHKLGHPDQALRAYERVHAMQAGFPGIGPALIHMYRSFGQGQRGRALFEGSSGAQDDEEIVAALAEVDSDLGGVERGMERLRSALARHPHWRVARTLLAENLLATCQWREGWLLYYRRHQEPGTAGWTPTLPARLEGKTVLLHGDQGLGDVLFFLRFASGLRARGARLVLSCHAKLLPLVNPGAILETVREATDADAAMPGDLRFLLSDLPALLGTEEAPAAWPLAIPEAEKERARARLAQLGPPPYLAATWRAGTDVLRRQEFGQGRRMLSKQAPPAELGAALRGWKGTVLALQRGASAEELAAFRGGLQGAAPDLAADGDELPRLLALLSQIDEYVGVSNTNMHLLAGLGRTARVLVPYPPDWRWTRGDGGSPWFPGFSVYREPQSRRWEQPLANLRKDLGL